MKYFPLPSDKSPSKPNTKIVFLFTIMLALTAGIFVGRASKSEKKCQQTSLFMANRDSCIVSNGTIVCIKKK